MASEAQTLPAPKPVRAQNKDPAKRLYVLPALGTPVPRKGGSRPQASVSSQQRGDTEAAMLVGG